jgi:hypothetical protein
VRTHVVLIKLMFRTAREWGFLDEDPAESIRPRQIVQFQFKHDRSGAPP